MPSKRLKACLLHFRSNLPRSLQLLFWRPRWPAGQQAQLRVQLRSHLQVPLVRLPAQYVLPHAESLLLQFKRLANIYFLIIGILQSIPEISPLGPLTAWAPLIVVLGISMIREGTAVYRQVTKITSDTSPIGRSISSPPRKFIATANSYRWSGARWQWERWWRWSRKSSSPLILSCWPVLLREE